MDARKTDTPEESGAAASRLRGLARRLGARRRAASLRLCCERNLMAVAAGRRGAPRSRILAYHSVGTPLWGDNDVGVRRFRSQLEAALESGYRFVPADVIAAGAGAPNDLAVTFDDGIASVATNAAPVLAELKIPWSLFVVSDWADGKAPWWPDGTLLGWREIERLATGGATIGSHSVTHQRLTDLPPDQVRYELEESRRAIASHLGVAPASFAIPMGQHADWNESAQAAARDSGYDIVYAQAEETRAPGTVGRTFITRWDNLRVFKAALAGRFDHWEEWY